jgi:hypothetical protein
LVRYGRLAKHLASVHFDTIDIIAYGTPKGNGRSGILFDDELPTANNGARVHTMFTTYLKS